MKNKKSIFLLFIILFISIGFALLSTNLNLNCLVGFSKSSWDVHFDNVSILSNDINASFPTIDANKTTINFGGTFSQPGEVFEFSVDVVNAGTIDAMLNEINKVGEITSNIKYSAVYYDDSEVKINDLLKSGYNTKIKVKVEYNYDIDSLKILEGQNFSLTLTYVSATKEAVDRDNLFKLAPKEHVVRINNAKANSLSDLKIYGNNEQVKINGNQVIKKDALSTPNSDSEFWQNNQHSTALSNGWRKVYFDNTTGTGNVYSNFFIKKDYVDLDPDTYYTAFLEWRNLEGIGSICLTQTNFAEDPFSEYINRNSIRLNNEISKSGSTKFLLKTKSDLTNSYGLRSWAGIKPGNKLSVEVKITLVKGDYYNDDSFDNITSPSPANPKEIKSVEGDSSLMIRGRNLLDYNMINKSAEDSGIIVDSNGYVSDTTPLEDTRQWYYNNCNFYVFLTPGTYTFSINFQTKTLQENNYDNMRIYNLSGEQLYFDSLHDKSKVVGTINITEATEIGFLIKSYEGVYRIQLEVGDKATSWEAYKEKEYPIPLGDIKLNGLGESRDYIHKGNNKWYIHREVETKNLSNLNIWAVNGTNSGPDILSSSGSFGLPLSVNNLTNIKKGNFLSNKFLFTDDFKVLGNEHSMRMNNNTCSYRAAVEFDRLYFRSDIYTDKTGVEIGTSLNNMDLYYILENSYEIEIKDENLINQLNTILEDNLFEGDNTITFQSSINSNIDFNYKQNM